jgi:hypothetical protein
MKNIIKFNKFLIIATLTFSCNFLQNNPDYDDWSLAIVFTLLDKENNERLIGSDESFKYHIDSIKLQRC